MSKKVVHVIGNGMMAQLFDHNAKGLRLCCNLAPFPVENVYASCIVDFKMMRALTEGSIQIPGKWILGYRPKIHMSQFPQFHMQVSDKIREFYTELPKYAKNYTDFNCGHFAVYYASQKLQADEIHLYGFDSLFDFDLRSCTDFYLSSQRDNMNTHRLNGNWRPIWYYMFHEFKDIKYKLYHKHSDIKIEPLPDNVEIVVRDPKQVKVSQ